MKRALLAAVLTLLIGPAAALARDVDTRDLSPFRASVVKLRAEVDRKLGHEAGGRDILRYGVEGKDGKVRPARHAKVVDYRDTLRHLIAPPPVAAAPSAVTASPYVAGVAASEAAPVSSAGGGGSAERFAGCESGGSWSAVNPSSGAYGRYQILPSHWSGKGQCVGLGKDPGGQTECANRIMATEGSGAWAQCGG